MNLSKRMIALFAVGAGISVANLYYLQPLLIMMGHTVHASVKHMGLVATLTQTGYALGLLLIVPLADILPRKTLMIGLSFFTAVALVGESFSHAFLPLTLFSFCIGALTVVPQIIIPLVADLSSPERRGQAIGVVMGGLLLGVLLARTVSGAVGALLGWQAMYWIAAGMMLVLAGVFFFTIHNITPTRSMRFSDLVRSVLSIAKKYRVLRHSALIGASLFAAFSALWTVLAYRLDSPPYHFNSAIVGLFGLVGAAGVLAAPFTGRVSDKLGPRFMVGVGILSTLVAYIALFMLSANLYAFIIAIVIMDFGTQAAQIANQTRIYALDANARNRINSVYMVTYFLGGAIGSALGSYFYSLVGWYGAMSVSIAMVLIALMVHYALPFLQATSSTE